MPRTAVFTLRSVSSTPWQCPGLEFEDTIVDELEPNAILIGPSQDQSQHFGIRTNRWLKRRGVPIGDFAFGARTMSMDQDVDLFFTAPATPRYLLFQSNLRNWRKRSKVAVCYLQELWVAEFDALLPWIIGVLNEFDFVFVGLQKSAEELSKRLSVPVGYLPLGIDAELFNPFRKAPKPRVIDVCSVGNISLTTHEALWNWAEDNGRYYHFSTMGSGHLTSGHRNHRRNLVQTLQRSNFFLTYMAKRAITGQRGSQEEFGPRYFEGAGAGAIQIGDAVRSSPAFLEHLNWQDAVIEAPFHSADLPALLESLEKDEAWLEDVRRENVANCLTRHDHVHRWGQVLEAVGLNETPAVAERRRRLQNQANALRERHSLVSSGA